MTDRPPIPARLTTEAQALAFIRAYRPHARLEQRAEGSLGGDWVVLQDASCGRCGGGGYLSCYAHVDGGRCFECAGAITAGAVHRIPALRYAQEGAAVERKRERERAAAAERAAEGARWLAAHPENATLTVAFADRTDGFAADLHGQLMRHGQLSDAQVAALCRAVERKRERERIRAEAPAPTGPGIEIAGTVVGLRDGQFGLQLVVRAAAGWSAMGPLPAAIWRALAAGGCQTRWPLEAIRAHALGRETRLTANLKASRDPALAYWSRPKQASLGPHVRPDLAASQDTPPRNARMDETAHYRAY